MKSKLESLKVLLGMSNKSTAGRASLVLITIPPEESLQRLEIGSSPIEESKLE